MIYKVRNHRDLISRYEEYEVDDHPDVILVAYGSPSRVMKSAVHAAREQGLKVGGIRLVSIWPFPDEAFSRSAKYLSVELNYDGQLVREVQRAVPKDSEVHFLGRCGELPKVAELVDAARTLIQNQALKGVKWQREAW